jgi:hypothetical protein
MEKKFYEKWWFWVAISIMAISLAFTVVMTLAFNMAVGEIQGLTDEMQKIYSNAKVYTSAEKSTLILELNNWDNDTDKLKEMLRILKEKLDDNELNTYTKLITISFINSSGNKEVLCVKQEYQLPNFNKESERQYIDFGEYKRIYNTLDKTVDNYNDLMNLIY